jgi:radical SAM protein with 4Fe4S-binding SPASM domain
MKITKVDRKYRFVSTFDTTTGEYFRSGTFVDGKETPDDPFQASYPELLDIGIKGSCAHASQCTVGCYQGGLENQKPDMSLEDYKSIIDQSKGKLFQIALGGHGDPNTHKDFEEILRYTREANIVPNYTTSGLNLTDEQVELTKKYCGAVAVSWYRSDYTLDAIERFVTAGCITNLHFVLSNKTIDEAINILKYHNGFLRLNAIIFLTHKPVGCGSQADVLSVDDPRLKEFCSLVSEKHPFKVGFDSCFIPALVTQGAAIDYDSVDTCEGARYSAYISSDMIMVPCSFDQKHNYGINLKNNSIENAWNSWEFNRFRVLMESSCSGCSDQKVCMGGCPLVPEIVLCDRKERS